MDNQDDTSLPPLSTPAPLDDDAPVPQNQPTSSGTIVDLPEEAADSDLIEKEWVMKAKEIVGHTSNDPHQQQEEIAKMKAEYMKKRYNRDVKLP